MAAVTDRQLAVDAFECGFASGRLKGMGVFDPDRGHGMALEIDGVDLGELLAVLEISDLSATGTISGVVPLYSEGDALRIAASLAAAPAGGTIRYLPVAGAAARLGVAGDLGMLAEALEDFHYDALSMGLEGDLVGDAVLRASVRGRNPSVEDGRPIHLNLRVETHLPSLLLGASASTRLPDVLERRLRDRVEQR